MSTRKGFTRRLIAAVGAATLATLGAATAASADSLPVAPEGGGSITVHKYVQPESSITESPDGTAIDAETLGTYQAIDDVTFTLYQVCTTLADGVYSGCLDLRTVAGWETAGNISDAFDAGTADLATDYSTLTIGTTPYYLKQVDSKRTATASGATAKEKGIAVFDGLDLSLYLVVESGTDDGVLAGTATPANIVTGSDPFLVSVPYENPLYEPGCDDSEACSTEPWNYNVHVYPKNSVTEFTKEVSDTGLDIPENGAATVFGKNIVWTLTALVPYQQEGEPLTQFKIVDTLHDLLTYKSTVVKLGGTALVSGTDYSLTLNSTQKIITITFLAKGETGAESLSWLEASAGEEVTVEITTDVSAVANYQEALDLADGVLDNKATLTVNGEDFSDSALTTWGELTIFKYKTADGEQVGLNDAVFTLYRESNNVDGLQTAAEGDTTVGSYTSKKVDEKDGYIFIPVLRTGTYYLVETDAPDGYVLDSTVRTLTVVQGETVESSFTNYAAIPNVPVEVPDLPLTGANGQLLLTIGGVALVLVGTGVALVSRKRAANKQ